MMESQCSSAVSAAVARIRERAAAAALAAGRRPEEISLMAVTKTQPAGQVNLAIEAGVRLLGENRAQELLAKYGDYNREGISIHFIGALQTNKVRQIVDKVDMIQSLDSARLAEEIERQCAKLGKVMDVLIEVNIGGEESKAGVSGQELWDLAAYMATLPHLRLRGLMTIPPVCEEKRRTEHFFYRAHELFVDMRAKNVDNRDIDVLSMGMSDDFELAIRHGATLVRIGSALFGARN